MERYLVKTDHPFNGSIQAIVYTDSHGIDRINDYDKYPTVSDYFDYMGKEFKIVNEEELDKLIKDYEESRITLPKRITRERYHDMLNVLPPGRWGYHYGAEFFFLVERIYGELVDWFCRIDGYYFAFVNYSYIGREKLIEMAKYCREVAIPEIKKSEE